MKTRDELLAMAEEHIGCAKGIAKFLVDYDTRDERCVTGNEAISAHAAIAQACVMLAKERREGMIRHHDDPFMVWDRDKQMWVMDPDA